MELLVVIVVIGILAAITIVAFNGLQDRAKINRAQSDFRTLEKAIDMARINRNAQLISITGSNCTRCYDQARYELTLDRIGVAAGMNLSELKAGDPWGYKYSIDENEGENGSCATRDLLGMSHSASGIAAKSIPFYSC